MTRRVLASLLFALQCIAAFAVLNDQAYLYQLGRYHGSDGSHTPLLSAPEARQALSGLLGFSKHLRLAFQGQVTRVMDQLGLGGGFENVFSPRKPELVFTISGIQDPVAVMHSSDKHHTPIFKISDSPPADSYLDMVRSLLLERDSNIETVYSDYFGGWLAFSPHLEGGSSGIHYKPDLESVGDKFGADIANALSLNARVDRVFASEILAVQSLIDLLATHSSLPAGQIVYSHMAAAEGIYHTYGVHSEQYKAACRAISILAHRLEAMNLARVTVALLPPTRVPGSLKQRRDMTNGAFEYTMSRRYAAPNSSFASSQCYESQAACNEATDSCSGHGECQRYLGREDCFACQCGVTKENGKATYWAGATCSKRDISVPFQLFLWTALFGVGILVWAIKLLYSIGNEELSSVLNASGPVPK